MSVTKIEITIHAGQEEKAASQTKCKLVVDDKNTMQVMGTHAACSMARDIFDGDIRFVEKEDV